MLRRPLLTCQAPISIPAELPPHPCRVRLCVSTTLELFLAAARGAGGELIYAYLQSDMQGADGILEHNGCHVGWPRFPAR
jgi:hypothetical protein